jgi:hypothetical protein
MTLILQKNKIKILKYVFTLPPPPKIQLVKYIFIYNTYIHIYRHIYGYTARE